MIKKTHPDEQKKRRKSISTDYIRGAYTSTMYKKYNIFNGTKYKKLVIYTFHNDQTK